MKKLVLSIISIVCFQFTPLAISLADNEVQILNAQSLYFTIDANYSIRTENAQGRMIRTNPTNLSTGQVVRIDNVHPDDIVYNDDDTVNSFETLTNYRARQNIPAMPYGSGDNEEIFFPVSVYGSTGEVIEFDSPPTIALLHAADRGILNNVAESHLRTSFLMSLPTEDRLRYVDYNQVATGEDDCMTPFLSLDIPNYFRDFSTLPVTQCTNDIRANGAHCLYPSIQDFMSYAAQGRTGVNNCIRKVREAACNSDFWKGMNLDQRINHTITKTKDILKEFDVNPFLSPCLTTKETTFKSSTIHTESACQARRRVPTALGAFQVNFFTLHDMVARGIFNMSTSDRNQTPPEVVRKLRPFLQQHLTPASYALLTDPGMGVRSARNEDATKDLAEEIYNLMTINFELQTAMFGTVLKAKNFSLNNYYGAANNNDANARYANYISSCVECMHERVANRNHNIHSCIALAKGQSPNNMEDYYQNMSLSIDQNSERYCDNDYQCQSGTCASN